MGWQLLVAMLLGSDEEVDEVVERRERPSKLAVIGDGGRWGLRGGIGGTKDLLPETDEKKNQQIETAH